jgi:hypothetical protein
MSKKKPSPAKEEPDAAVHVYRAATKRFGFGLKLAAERYATGKWNDESAAVAVAATIGYIRAISPQRHLLAPLYHALEIIEAAIDAPRRPACRRDQAIVMDIDAHIGKPLPPIDQFEVPVISEDAAAKVAGLIAVECQHRNGVLMKDAYLRVTGDSVLARQLEDFKESIFGKKNSPKHAREFYFGGLRTATQKDGHDPELLARETLRTYRNFLGQSFPKVAKKSRNSPRQKTGKPLSISGQNRDY